LSQLLTIASGNPSKVAEIEAMLGPLPLEVQRQPDDLDVEETGDTYLEATPNLKATAAALRTKGWAIADDSGLEVDALQGSSRPLLSPLRNGDQAKVQRILDELATLLTEAPASEARWCSAIQWATALQPRKGCAGERFLKHLPISGGGYESLLWVREAGCTYGQLNESQLSRLGSRGKAARALATHLKQFLKLH